MDNIFLDLGFIQIQWYSFLMLVAISVASILIIFEGKKYKIRKDFMENLIFWSLIFGLIGSRLYYVLFNWDFYGINKGEIWRIWEGGLAIHGGLLLGLLFVFVYCKKYKVRFLRITDIYAVGLILAQAIGRWGNFFNKEAHGPMVSREHLESLRIIPEFVIEGMYIEGAYYHPTFFYESMWCLLGFIVLILIRRFYTYLRLGQLTAIYLMWYSLGRFFIEILRTDSLMFQGYKSAQIVSVIIFSVGLFLFFKIFRTSKFENRYKEEVENEIRF